MASIVWAPKPKQSKLAWSLLCAGETGRVMCEWALRNKRVWITGTRIVLRRPKKMLVHTPRIKFKRHYWRILERRLFYIYNWSTQTDRPMGRPQMLPQAEFFFSSKPFDLLVTDKRSVFYSFLGLWTSLHTLVLFCDSNLGSFFTAWTQVTSIDRQRAIFNAYQFRTKVGQISHLLAAFASNIELARVRRLLWKFICLGIKTSSHSACGKAGIRGTNWNCVSILKVLESGRKWLLGEFSL